MLMEEVVPRVVKIVNQSEGQGFMVIQVGTSSRRRVC
jgi:hypothetical protein